MDIRDGIKKIEDGIHDSLLLNLYDASELDMQRARYTALLDRHSSETGFSGAELFSTPGRTELGGNHTDHNQGKVLAAAIHLDTLAAVTPSENMVVRVNSEGYPSVVVDLSHLDPIPEEKGRTDALVRGIAARFINKGWKIGGFTATTTTRVLKGSGLSSSAALEVLIGTIFNVLYNEGAVSTTDIAMAGQYGENVFFGKPCGLMDQVACANGGLVKIDFKDKNHPVIEALDYSFRKEGFSLLVVDTGGNHADLTPEYAAIPEEMKQAAALTDSEILGQTSETDLLPHIKEHRKEIGDRAILRGLHFFRENRRVSSMIDALSTQNFDEYLKLVQASGDSSFKFLQNVYASSAPDEQGISLALALTEGFLEGTGACRVHGGGFAGTIQVYIPTEKTEEYTTFMEGFFEKGCVTELKVRTRPTCRIMG